MVQVNVDGHGLWSLLEEVNSFGALDSGGVERLAWTESEIAARRWLMQRCEEEGLTVVQDEAGNVWAFGDRRPAVIMGSHLDTVPNGGRFDGALGVSAALAALLAAKSSGAPGSDRLGLVCFTDEEGVRFGLGMTGSRAVAGDLSLAELEGAVTSHGTKLADVLADAGFDAARFPKAGARREDMAAYLELHVEQGRRLERAGLPLAIVTGIVGLSHWRVDVDGEANHAGTTLPADRHDALIPLAAAALEARHVMRATEGLVATVGEAEVMGGAMNVVPGRARFSLDVRNLDESAIDDAVERILDAARSSAEENKCELRPQETKRLRPAPMAPDVLDAMRHAAADLGVEVLELASLAGHDAMGLAKAGVPCGMIFVRSEGGISHSPRERSSKQDCALGAELLGHAALELARKLP